MQMAFSRFFAFLALQLRYVPQVAFAQALGTVEIQNGAATARCQMLHSIRLY